ncbi:MAG: YfhO family protein, partial [Gemmatimonadales bacterium]
SAAFTIHLAISVYRAREAPLKTVLGRMGFALGAVAIGLSIGAIQYLPVREYVSWSPRAGGLADYATAVSYAWPSRELFDAYLPQFSGMIDAYWGENAIHLHSDYVGVVVLVLAGAAFLGLRRDPRKGFILFWTGTLLIALLWALGGHTPFYRIPYEIIPGTKYFRAPATVFFVGTMALAVLSATGLERALTRELSLKYAFTWLAFAVIVAALGTLGILNDFARAFATEDMVDMVIANSKAVTIGAWRSLVVVVLVIAIIWIYKRGKMPLAVAGWSFAFLAAIDSWTILRDYWIFSPPASVIFKSDAAIESIKRDPILSRVLTIELEENPRRDINLEGDGLMIHRVRTVLGYHGNQLGRYNTLLEKDAGFQQVFNPRMWELLNVRYLLTNSADVNRYFRGAQWVIGPVKDAAGTDVYLYRLPGENPYAWVAPVAVKASDESVLVTLFDPAFDLKRAALFALDADVVGADTLSALPAAVPVKASVSHYEPGKVSLDLSSPAPAGSALLVSENYFPGWSATADGKPAKIGRANFSLIGVQLPEGARKVELVFDDPAYVQGKMITILALVLTLVLIAAGTVMEKRKIA